MKLRISGDSLRLRLSRSEVELLRQSAEVEDAIHFGADQLQYAVAVGNGVVRATYAGNRIRVEIPRRAADEFTNTDLVSVEGEQSLPSGTRLQILIEKDFKCIHKESPGDADAYPNPLAETV